MVGPLVLLKMLHCRQLRKQESARTAAASSETTHDGAKVVKIKQEDEGNICRVCLKEGSIYIFDDNMEDIPEALKTFCGIDVRIDDTHPKFLCSSCNSILLGVIVLRRTAQQSEEYLKQRAIDMLIEKQQNDGYKTETVFIANSQNGMCKSEVEDNMSDDHQNDDDKSDVQDFDTVKHKGSKRGRNAMNVQVSVKRQKSHHCRKCDMSFGSFKEYNDHRMSEEHENRRHTCPICHNSYTALYIKRHLTLHQDTTPFICDICGKDFVMQGPFARHRLTHFYELPFKCSLCPYRGRFKESLKMHMRSHTGERPYQCTECPSRFISKSNLNKHALTHKAEHDFKCDTCGRGFYTKRELELHYKVDHTGLKDHVCDTCGKAFGYRKQMMKHQLKVHKRDKLRSGRMPLYLKVESMKQQEDNATES